MSKKLYLLFFALIGLVANAQSAFKRAAHGLEYEAEATVTTGKGTVPLWMTANRYGAAPVSGDNGLLRLSLHHHANRDSLYYWRVGYGADVLFGYGQQRPAMLQQLYFDIDCRLVRLSIGSKQTPMMLKNQALSSGSQTLGINARPVPQVRLGLPEYWNISGRADVVAIKGFIGYGMMTHGRYLSREAAPGANYARYTLYHSKAGYLRLGNEKKFPLTFEGGLEMASTFGGTIYNAGTWDGTESEPIKLGHSFRDFMDATFGVGGDVTDGNGYANATGNTVGSWVFRLGFKGKNWKISAYYDHFFEDHSQMFFQYGWLDGLLGIEAELPRNPVLSNVLYEYIRTDYQSGPVYHDKTAAIPDQISGKDNYYNHNLYAGWQHWGQAIGNPLFISPLYNNPGRFSFTGNRFTAHHVGLSGDPSPDFHYRLRYSYQRNLGTYDAPFSPALKTNSFAFDATYSPMRLGRLNTNGWSLGASFAMDRGDLLGNNWALQFSLIKRGILNR